MSTRHVFWEVNHDEKGKSIGNGQILGNGQIFGNEERLCKKILIIYD